MKKKICLFSICIAFFLNFAEAKSAVSYIPPTVFFVNGKFVRSRLGDQMITYTKARWVAHKSGLPFHFVPFEYSDHFVLDDSPLRDNLLLSRDTILERITNIAKIPSIHKQDRLYIIDFVAMVGKDHSVYGIMQLKRDKQFLQLMRNLFTLREPVDTIPIPPDCISVAVHIRKGGGFDHPLFSEQIYDVAKVRHLQPTQLPPGVTKNNQHDYGDCAYPLKFPPEQFYIEQIRKLAKKTPNKTLYVFLFTDEPDTAALVERFTYGVSCDNVFFDYRRDNPLNHNVLEDLFSMMKFDCIIRPGQSAFSVMAQFLGNHRIAVYPEDSQWQGPHLVMRDIKWETTD